MKRSKSCTEGSLHIQKNFFKNKQKTPKNPSGASISPQYSRFFPCIQRHLNLGYSLWITQNVWSWTQLSPSTDYTGDHTQYDHSGTEFMTLNQLVLPISSRPYLITLEICLKRLLAPSGGYQIHKLVYRVLKVY